MNLKEIENTKERIIKKILAYERKYIRSEDGLIGLEIAYEVECEFKKLVEKMPRLLQKKQGCIKAVVSSAGKDIDDPADEYLDRVDEKTGHE